MGLGCVGLGGSMGLGWIYGAGGAVVGFEGLLWGWGGSYGVAVRPGGSSMGLGGILLYWGVRLMEAYG